jgi:AsmA family protein
LVGQSSIPRSPAPWVTFKRLRVPVVVVSFVLAVVATLWACESAGWPFLAAPVERWLSGRLQREVSLKGADAIGFQLKLFGAIDLQVKKFTVAKADWSTRGPMGLADNLHIRLGYRELFSSRNGGPLRLELLSADTARIDLERRSANQANWMFRDKSSEMDLRPFFETVSFGSIRIGQGNLSVIDAVRNLTLQSEFRFGQNEMSILKSSELDGLFASGKGRFREFPVSFSLTAGSTQVLWKSDPAGAVLPFSLSARVGDAKLNFKGSVIDPLERREIKGTYVLSGPSLALVGLPLGVILPTTRTFEMKGRLSVRDSLWSTVVDSAEIGRSRLSGAFQFDTGPGHLPTLMGQLRGSVLWLEDLGPAIGMPIDNRTPRLPGARLLPQRPFNLPALGLMNANVLVNLDRLESGNSVLQAVAPLRARILLNDAQLQISDIDARLAQGQVRGNVRIDGRKTKAQWQVHLLASKIELSQWVKQERRQARASPSPPFISGRLAARIDLKGEGRSTAEMLATSDGKILMQLTRGTVSHLAIELAGIDIAQSLGVWLKGDDSLPITCGVADLEVKAGVARSKVVLVDTKDSTLWLEGTVSLADEKIDLEVKVNPKDFSPLALRSPLQVNGQISAPVVSIKKTPFIGKLVSAIVLGAISPLAAFLPLIDVGDDSANLPLAACRAAAAQGLTPKSKR